MDSRIPAASSIKPPALRASSANDVCSRLTWLTALAILG